MLSFAGSISERLDAFAKTRYTNHCYLYLNLLVDVTHSYVRQVTKCGSGYWLESHRLLRLAAMGSTPAMALPGC